MSKRFLIRFFKNLLPLFLVWFIWKQIFGYKKTNIPLINEPKAPLYTITKKDAKNRADLLYRSFDNNGWSLTDEKTISSVVDGINSSDWYLINKFFGKRKYNMFWGSPAFGPFWGSASGEYYLDTILKREISIFNPILYRRIKSLYEDLGVSF
mgnify:FL=1